MVHAAAGVTAGARALAESLPADPEHELVVADVPAVSQIEVWKSFVAALPRGRRPVRVVPGQEPYEIAPYVWQWLADRSGRPVLAPYGRTARVARSLFVHSAEHSGWVWFRRGVASAWQGKRFPQPVWDTIELGQLRAAGFRGVAEPLPAGMWLRPDVGDGVLAADRTKLTRTLPCLPDAPMIVLGARNVPDLELADVAEFLRTLRPEVAATARFVRFGGVALPPGATFGQALADVLDAEVHCYAGIPAGAPDALEVLALRADGSLGWNTFAQALAYRPRSAGPPRVCGYRQPIAGLGEVSPGVFWYAPEVVLEVVQAGLWIRPAAHVGDTAGVRATPLDPVHGLLLYEATEPTWADRLRDVAENVLDRLDDTTRLAARLMPTTALSDAALAGVTPRAVDRPTEVLRPPEQPAPPREPVAEVPEPPETDLPWLSRLMETVAMPVPVRPADTQMGHSDDRAE